MAKRPLLCQQHHHAILSLVLLLLLALLVSSSTSTAVAATPTLESYSYSRWSRKLLVTAPRVSPETRQDMDVGSWRRTPPLPLRRAGASLGRRVPRSHANPSHN
ncbi:hypothetical protein BS78_08G085200 [Paspalum vaginatum]|nr:hypothetical protein BS78_08G085200 [Paspalum vaginatum]KAJ1265561.1 hypothetical protein BS78_08G085200 [Paspalum vaginatum]